MANGNRRNRIDAKLEMSAGACSLLQPSRPIFCTSKNEDGTDHMAPFGWCTPVSGNPPLVVLALQNAAYQSQTMVNVKRTGEFVINLPGMELAYELVQSSYDTRQGGNKFDRSGLTRLPSEQVAPPGIAECAAVLECRVVESLQPGDHALFIGRVVCARYDSSVFGENLNINMANFLPVVHMNQYICRELGAQVHTFVNPVGVASVEVPYADNGGE